MPAEHISGKVSFSEKHYCRRTDTPRRFWPHGVLRVGGLITLYVIGASFVAPDMQSNARRYFLDLIQVVNVGSSASETGQVAIAHVDITAERDIDVAQ